MSYQVHLTDAASVQIEQSAGWWAEHHSLEQALYWLNEIHLRIATLAENPERWAIARESPQFPFEVHELLFGVGRRPTHRVLFRIVENIVEVLAVRHVAQDKVGPGDL